MSTEITPATAIARLQNSAAALIFKTSESKRESVKIPTLIVVCALLASSKVLVGLERTLLIILRKAAPNTTKLITVVIIICGLVVNSKLIEQSANSKQPEVAVTQKPFEFTPPPRIPTFEEMITPGAVK